MNERMTPEQIRATIIGSLVGGLVGCGASVLFGYLVARYGS